MWPKQDESADQGCRALAATEAVEDRPNMSQYRREGTSVGHTADNPAGVNPAGVKRRPSQAASAPLPMSIATVPRANPQASSSASMLANPSAWRMRLRSPAKVGWRLGGMTVA